MSNSYFEHVGDFHRKFGLPQTYRGRPATLMTEELYQYRLQFLKEELAELEAARAANNLVGFADALADLVWVGLGTAHFAGLPFSSIWWHVRQANMTKILAPSDAAAHKRDAGGHRETIRKPPNWVGPEKGIEHTIFSWNQQATK